MRQTHYLHNGAHFNSFLTVDSLPIPSNAPIDGQGVMTIQRQDELVSVLELGFKSEQIPVVSQNSQEGESFNNQLQMPVAFHGLTL
jgi:hypothetical protein